MEFARLRSRASYSLSWSGVASLSLAELGVRLEDLEINGPSSYGYEPLLERIARYCGVGRECVVTANGTSMANHLAMAATFEPGDDVLIEQPTYELLLRTAGFLGANIRRFQRPFEHGFGVDLDDLKRQVTTRTRLIVLCNLHNPSSVLLDDDTLRSIGDIARSVGARVLVDEVYLEAVFPSRPQTALRLGPEFIVTSSLTKAYGLSGLRCGWILAEPELARRIWRINDCFGVHQPHCADRLSVVAFDKLGRLAQRAQGMLDANRRVLHEFLSSRPDLDTIVPGFGTVVFPRIKEGSVDELFSLLLEKYDTSIVPGRFFEMPQHFRIGIGGGTKMFTEALDRLGTALCEISGHAG
jgi:aspartate/methionine/tyrosine aminotransferase